MIRTGRTKEFGMVLRKVLISLMGLALLTALGGVRVAVGEFDGRAEDLRREVMHRFMTQVRTNTGMDDSQFARFETMARPRGACAR